MTVICLYILGGLEFPMHWLFRPPVFHHLLIVPLLHILEFFAFFVAVKGLDVLYIFYVPASTRYFVASLETEYRALPV